jgi:hypothetical protein
MISVACRVLEVTVLAWNNITQAAPWVMGDSGKHYLDMLEASPRDYASSCSQKTGPACRGGSRQCACRGAAGLGWVGLGAWACGPGRAGRWGGAKRRAAPEKRPLGPTSPVPLALAQFRTYAASKPTGCFPRRFERRFFLYPCRSLPVICSSRQETAYRT